MEIRKIEPRDFAEIANLENLNWTLNATPHLMNSSAESIMQKILKGTTYLLAVENDEILGFLDYGPRHASEFGQHVLTFGLVTVEKYRSHGVGTALIHALFSEARAENALKITMNVLSSNPTAIQLYEHLGFVQEAALHKEFLINGAYVDDLIYAYYL
ncbi:GNAT family N-acetyltransferase [Lactococcus nasutitermitis]|uniref:GNAT family N-acetyltransferase n=1 Tax=Lactococcus nasutitermitis TaxID=1652957 RepID=A0ABV9JE91_9LACT|nr:GNAT family N-acetyltransferase [Lactococcus nasutitermitis]